MIWAQATRWGKIAVVGIAITLAIVDGIRAVSHATATDPAAASDLPQYRGAARAAIEGTSLYEVRNSKGSPYSGSPALAVAMLPLLLVNEFWGSLLWYVLTLLMSVHAMWLCARIGRKFWPVAASQQFWWCSLACLLVLPHFWNGLRWQNVSLLVTYLLIASLWFYLHDRSCLAGLCLAGGIVLKVFPVLLVLYFAWKRRFGVVAFAAVWLVVILVVVPSGAFGWKGNLAYLKQWWTEVCLSASAPDAAAGRIIFKQAYSVGRSNNQSAQAVLYRLIVGRRGLDDPSADRLARLVGRTVAACLLLASVYLMWRGRAERGQQRTVLEFSFALLVMLLVSPVALFHYFTLLALPVTVGIMSVAGGASSDQSRVYLMGLAIYGAANLAVSVSNVFFTHGVLLIGVLALWGSFFWALAHGQGGPVGAGGAREILMLRQT